MFQIFNIWHLEHSNKGDLETFKKYSKRDENNGSPQYLTVTSTPHMLTILFYSEGFVVFLLTLVIKNMGLTSSLIFSVVSLF